MSAHSRLHPDFNAASIATKSTADVAVYLSFLRSSTTSSDAAIAHDLHTAAHEASAALVAIEEKQSARICAAEPACAQETDH